ncbi:MAG: DNA-directed RNA polymerase subunit alpha [Chloroflexota bacterium]
MSRLVVPNIDCVESVDNYGRFVAEPLETGFGVTLGNSLRRALLGFLPGAAVTRVKVDGIQHEFSVLPEAKEDVMEFLLNVKELRLKPITGRPGNLVLEVQGDGKVSAADIKPSADFEIANPELCLVTLSSPKAKLYVEFEVELGVGYQTAVSSNDMPVGTIPVDAIFTPIRKVNYNVSKVHFGQETSREKLTLEVWTDGTISPVDAVSQGATILIEQLTPFVDYAKVSQMKEEERLIRMSIPDEKYNMPVEQLDLSVRTMNCLRRSNIATVGELIGKGAKELLKLRNFGQKSFLEIEEKLEGMGLSLNASAEVEEGDNPEKSAKKAGATATAEAEEPATGGEPESEPGETESESESGEEVS